MNADFYDDSSSSLGMSHSYRSAAPASAGPISADELERRREAAEKYQRITRPIAEAAIAAGTGPIKHDPRGMIVPINRGAYVGIANRVREIQGMVNPETLSEQYPQGRCYSFSEATTIALEESSREHQVQRSADADYLGDSIENLMSGPDISGGGGSRGRNREYHANAATVDARRQYNYDQMLVDHR